MATQYVQMNVGYFFIAVLCLMIILGIPLNVFIVVVNLNCWRKPQPRQAIDIIITSLATVRIVLLCLYTLVIFDVLSTQSIIHMDLFPEHTKTLMMCVEFCSLWWGSVLCVFYCVKITNYSNRFFMRLKMNVSKTVPWLLLISLAISCLSSLSYKWFVFSLQSFNGTNGQVEVIKTNWLNYFMSCFGGSILPFIIFCISVGLLIVSLLRHTRNMSGRDTGFGDAQRDVHLGIIRNMIYFLVFYVLYFVGSNLLPVGLFRNQALSIFSVISCTAFPSLHSICLIVSNRELKKAIMAVLRCSCRSPKVDTL